MSWPPVEDVKEKFQQANTEAKWMSTEMDTEVETKFKREARTTSFYRPATGLMRIIIDKVKVKTCSDIKQ